MFATLSCSDSISVVFWLYLVERACRGTRKFLRHRHNAYVHSISTAWTVRSCTTSSFAAMRQARDWMALMEFLCNTPMLADMFWRNISVSGFVPLEHFRSGTNPRWHWKLMWPFKYHAEEQWFISLYVNVVDSTCTCWSGLVLLPYV